MFYSERPTIPIPTVIDAIEPVVYITQPTPLPGQDVILLTTSEPSSINFQPSAAIIEISQDSRVPAGATIELSCTVANAQNLKVNSIFL